MLPNYRLIATALVASAACVRALDAGYQQCGTSAEVLPLLDLLPEGLNQGTNLTARDEGPRVVPVYVTVLLNDDTPTGGYVSKEQIYAEINWVNAQYRGLGIVFDASVRDIRYDLRPDLFPGGQFIKHREDKDQWEEYRKINNQYFPERYHAALNLFFLYRLHDVNLVGTLGTWFLDYFDYWNTAGPEKVRKVTGEALLITSAAIPGNNLLTTGHTNTLIHEIGHWLGLEHTDGKNCTVDNDGIPDTPRHLTSELEEIKKYCAKEGDIHSSCGYGPAPIQNYMVSVKNEACPGYHFTDGQKQKMSEVYARRLFTTQQQGRQLLTQEWEQRFNQQNTELNNWLKTQVEKTNQEAQERLQELNQQSWSSQAQVQAQQQYNDYVNCLQTAVHDNARDLWRLLWWERGYTPEGEEAGDRNSIEQKFQQKKAECRNPGQTTSTPEDGRSGQEQQDAALNNCLGNAKEAFGAGAGRTSDWMAERTKEFREIIRRQEGPLDIVPWQEMYNKAGVDLNRDWELYQQQARECNGNRK